MNPDLLLKKEYFPNRLVTPNGHIFNPQIPPFHKSILREGIDIDMALSVIDEVLESVVLEFEQDADEFREIGFDMRPKGKSALDRKSSGEGVLISGFPLIKSLYIDKGGASPYGGDYYIHLHSSNVLSSYYVPNNIILPEKLMQEYQMEEASRFHSYKIINCPTRWSSHNLRNKHRLVYKNLVISLNNAATRAANATGT